MDFWFRVGVFLDGGFLSRVRGGGGGGHCSVFTYDEHGTWDKQETGTENRNREQEGVKQYVMGHFFLWACVRVLGF